MSKSMIWILVGIAAVVFFGPELMSILGWVIGGIISIGVTGIVMVVVAAAIFFGVMAIGGSVVLGIAAAFIAVLLAALSSLWPILLVAGLLYLFFRKSPRSV